MGKKVSKVISSALGSTIGGGLGLFGNQGDAGSTQAAPAVATPAATPTAVSDETLEAREAQRRRQLAAAGLSGTNLTGGGLASAANTGAKTLLGS